MDYDPVTLCPQDTDFGLASLKKAARTLYNLWQSGSLSSFPTRSIWLAADRMSGGNGTPSSPLSANTKEKLDAIWAANTGVGINFHYYPGVYNTTGWKFRTARTAKPWQRHYGTGGMFDVTLRLQGSSGSSEDGIIFGTDYDTPTPGFGVSNMTLDSNGDNQPKKGLGIGSAIGANAFGSHILIENVRFIGYGTFEVGRECFPCIVAFDPSVTDNFEDVWIKGCRFELPSTGNRDGLTCCAIYVNPTSGSTGRNMGISDSYFGPQGNGFLYENGSASPITRNCYFDGIQIGIYTEATGPQSSEFLIEGCTFLTGNLQASVLARFGSYNYDGYTIRNNRFFFTNAGAIAGFKVVAEQSGRLNNLIFKDNVMKAAHGVTLVNTAGMTILSTDNAKILRNEFIMGNGHEIQIYTALNTGIVTKDNLASDGTDVVIEEL